MVNEIHGKQSTFIFGTFGRRFFVDAVAYCVNVFCCGLEEFVDSDAGVFVLDASVF